MANKINLRFLLALGGQKVVITQQHDELQIYADQRSKRPNVSAVRMADVLSSR